MSTIRYRLRELLKENPLALSGHLEQAIAVVEQRLQTATVLGDMNALRIELEDVHHQLDSRSHSALALPFARLKKIEYGYLRQAFPEDKHLQQILRQDLNRLTAAGMEGTDLVGVLKAVDELGSTSNEREVSASGVLDLCLAVWLDYFSAVSRGLKLQRILTFLFGGALALYFVYLAAFGLGIQEGATAKVLWFIQTPMLGVAVGVKVVVVFFVQNRLTLLQQASRVPPGATRG